MDFLESSEFWLSYLHGISLPEGEREPLTRIVTKRPTKEQQIEIKNRLRAVRLNILNPPRACVPRSSQSILHAIADVDPFLQEALEIFKKAPFSEYVEKYVGHRPKAFFFMGEEFGLYTKSIEEIIERAGAAYLKESSSYNGLGVYRISGSRGRYRIQVPHGTETIHSLDAFPFKREAYLVEEEIPIAKIAQRTWEIRIIPPYGNAFTYGKVARASDAHLNNYAQGGYEGNATTLIRKVLEYHGGEREEAERFMEEARDLAVRVKSLSDCIQVTLAKEILKPEDIREDAGTYNEIMSKVFSGTFFVVDITGVFENGRLQPRIVEVQASGGLPEPIGYAAHDSVRAYFSQKFQLLKEVVV